MTAPFEIVPMDDPKPKCQEITKTGNRCKALALTDESVCLFHSKSEEAQQARVKGGINSSTFERLLTNIKGLKAEVYREMWIGMHEVETGDRTTAVLHAQVNAGKLLLAIEQEAKAEQNEQRIAVIENIAVELGKLNNIVVGSPESSSDTSYSYDKNGRFNVFDEND